MRHANWDALTPDAEQPWETLETRVAVPPPRSVHIDRVRTHAGDEIEYTYRPRGPRAVFILPVTDAGEAILIRQYRYPLRATITEVVAGGVERDEDPQGAAERELLEEVGGTAREWVALPGFYPQPSISGVVFLPYLALGVRVTDAQPERTELITPVRVPLRDAYARLEAGEIHDGPSSLTLYHARAHLHARGLI
ncbi:NUDIX domain-containing protein [Deinococcus maricopensis]|uniref:NUDIX hydrolase n=1 Tax=Deinococcus maricopensis (strain DSM 21211 / LMG 22137 / NRRL B-23946 / LB-34) TaxID=709986 RepID=E8UC56_DEIML|nr:NUDIX hydrolase [Deinococcus maricopensis]ADV68717.1 NUDIX hydrolase [Deinococcus maricopensis DSM 21211]